MNRFSEKYLSLVPVALLCLGFVYIASGTAVHDFANYYFGGKFIGENRFTSDIYFPYWFNRQIIADGHSPIFAGFAPNTPFLAVLFYLLSFLSISVAKIVFNLLSVGLFLFSLKRLADYYKVESIYLFLIPVFFLVPIRNEILFGQVYLLLFFFLAESWLAYEKKQLMKTAVFLSLAIMLKVFPALLLFFFAFRKDFKILSYSLIGCGLIFLMTLPFCSIETWHFYLTDVLNKASNGEIASAYVANYQSVFMFLKQLLVYDAVENPNGLFSNPIAFAAVIFAFKIKVLAIGWYVTKKVESQLFVFSYWIFACILISPYGSTYTFILMLFLYFATIKSDIAQWKKMSLLVLIFLISNLPLSLFMNVAFPVSYLRFFFLAGFFALLVSMIWKFVNWKMVSAVALIAIALKLTVTDKQNAGDYFLPKESPLLIYDYQVINGKFTYLYWDEKGINTANIPIKIESFEPADLTRNQIYYRGKKMVYDDSHKLKPAVINGKTLIYLTDSNRGIGFYTFRKIDLR